MHSIQLTENDEIEQVLTTTSYCSASPWPYPWLRRQGPWLFLRGSDAGRRNAEGQGQALREEASDFYMRPRSRACGFHGPPVGGGVRKDGCKYICSICLEEQCPRKLEYNFPDTDQRLLRKRETIHLWIPRERCSNRCEKNQSNTPCLCPVFTACPELSVWIAEQRLLSVCWCYRCLSSLYLSQGLSLCGDSVKNETEIIERKSQI